VFEEYFSRPATVFSPVAGFSIVIGYSCCWCAAGG
jgi:hypothetical protein